MLSGLLCKSYDFVANKGGASVLPTEDLDAYDVWPAVYKRPKAPRVDGPPVDDDVARRRRPKRRTGGVRLLAPHTVTELVPEDGGVLFADDVDDDEEAVCPHSYFTIATSLEFSNRSKATAATTTMSPPPPPCHQHHHHHCPHIHDRFYQGEHHQQQLRPARTEILSPVQLVL